MTRQHARPMRQRRAIPREHVSAVAGALAILAVIGALCLFGAPVTP